MVKGIFKSCGPMILGMNSKMNQIFPLYTMYNHVKCDTGRRNKKYAFIPQ